MLSDAIYGSGLTKSALNARPIWNGVKQIFHKGLWPKVGEMAQNRISHTGGGIISKGLLGTSKFMGGGGGTALGAYGFAGMVPGLDLPGSDLALNATMPILGAAFTAPNVIKSMRAGTDKGKAAIKQDGQVGAQQAADEFLAGLDADPGIVNGGNNYRNLMERYGIQVSPNNPYTNNRYNNAPGGLKTWQTLFGNSDEFINDRVRKQIQNQFNKRASIGSTAMKWGGKAMSSIGSAFKWTAPPLAAYGIYDAVTGKPHNAELTQGEGYAATQEAIQKKLNSLNGMERFALKMDPTLAAQKIEEILPGTIKRWEGRSGRKFQPGFISSTMNEWKSGGTPSYYTRDDAGTRHYI